VSIRVHLWPLPLQQYAPDPAVLSTTLDKDRA
jgi:hypothetical protein